MIAPGAALHGEQCGIGTIMMAKLHGLEWEKIRGNLTTLGAPTSAEELGIDGETLVKAIVKAGTIRPKRYTILNETKLTRKSARKLAESCGLV
jgi:glycerol-1-phosphate dehydrogenase [NAD(P)+]